MTDQRATELSHPRVGAFDDSAPFVATQLPSNFSASRAPSNVRQALSQRRP